MNESSVDWVERWEGEEGAHWVDEAERYDAMNRAFGEALLDAADLRPGETVLDIGCGNGATTIEAAKRVRPGGSALGVDLSPRMLTLARKRAAGAEAGEAEFLQADAQVHPFGEGERDVVVSRFGVMFFEDPVAAFGNIVRALRPGGRMGFTAWRDMMHSEWIVVPGAAAAEHVGLPEGIGPNAPGPFALGDPDRIRDILRRVDLREVTVEEVTRPMRIGADLDDVETFFTRSLPLVRDLLAAAPADKAAAAVAAAREALVPYAGPAGVVMDNNSAWLVTARR